MNFLSKSILPITRLFKTPQNALKGETPETPQKSKKRQSHALKRQRNYIAAIGQDELRNAILMAEEPLAPRREYLLAIYKEVLRDFHLRSQVKTAINEVISEPWVLVDKVTKKPNEEATMVLEKQWFDNVTRFVIEAEFWGHSLIEFGVMVENTGPSKALAPFIFKDTKLIWREHVRPETGELLINPFDDKGFPFREKPFNTWLLEAGDPFDLGLLEIAARYSIFKRFTLSDWSRSGEKWGDPVLVLRSASDDDKENDKKEEFAANFGNNGYAIFDDDDQVELLERKQNNGHLIFKDFVGVLDEENSKGVNGQTATSDTKAFVGSAEVQERILNGYTSQRLKSVYYFHNDKTLPFLIEKGYKLEGLEWIPKRYLAKPEEEKTLEEKENATKEPAQKKKSLYQMKSILE